MVNPELKCKMDQIYNAKTKRCVAINGKPGKALISAYEKGEAQLTEVDIAKIKGLLKKNNATAPNKPIQQQAEINSAKIKDLSQKKPIQQLTTNTKKCKNNEIYNDKSKRCVDAKGSVAKKLISQFQKGEIQLLPEDVQKLESMGLLKPQVKAINVKPVGSPQQTAIANDLKNELTKIVVNSPKITSPDPNAKLMKVPIGVQHKIHNFVARWKQNKLKMKKATGLQDYCKLVAQSKGNMALLSLPKPIITSTFNGILPSKGLTAHGFSVEHLDSKKFPGNLSTKTANFSFNMNNYTESVAKIDMHQTLEDIENSVDFEWIKEANEYLMTLQIEDIYTIIGYTHYGDVLCNNFAKKTLVATNFYNDIQDNNNWFLTFFPLYFQMKKLIQHKNNLGEFLKSGILETDTVSYTKVPNVPQLKIIHGKSFEVAQCFSMMKEKDIKNSVLYPLLYGVAHMLDFETFWKPCIEMFIHDLNNIVQKSPSVKNTMQVYRGVKTNYFLTGNVGYFYKTNTFVSTTLKVDTALQFATSNGWVKRITVLPGSKCILIGALSKYPAEMEILFGSDSIFYITDNERLMNMRNENVCSNIKVKVSDLVIVK